MRFELVAVLCLWVVLATGDVAHLKAKARLASRIAKHKRGVLSSVPTFKLGHDIPHVTHSVVKPVVVTYPPAASVTAVKVPLAHPLIHRYPVGVGHKVPVPHPHYGLKFPHHHHTKTFVKPDQHFHHHHHHVAPRPVVPVIPAPVPAPAVPVPVPATPVVPIAQPAGTVVHPVPAPSPPVFLPPAPIVPPPAPVAPPPVQVLPPHLSPVFPAAQVPLHPAPIVPAPVFPHYPYIIRPGNAIQTSFFATYPRYPFNYQQLIPLTAPAAPLAPVAPVAPLAPVAPVAPTVSQVFLDRPHAHVPHFHLAGHDVIQHTAPGVSVEPTPTLLHPTQAAFPQPAVHLQPTQPVPVEHDGWSPVPVQPTTPVHTHTEAHFHQQPEHHFTQEQGTQVFEQHTNEQQYHDYQHQLQHHIQQQIDQAQYEQSLNNQHQLSQEYGAPQQEYGQPNQEFSHHAQEYSQHAQEYSQHGQEYSQHGQEYSQHAQEYAQHEQQYAQQEQEYAHQQQLGHEYGLPQQELQGRSTDSEAERDTQLYHNHIPLGLQPPINRPLEHFR